MTYEEHIYIYILQVLSKHLKEEGGKGEGGSDYAAALTVQVQRLSQELRQLASSSRTVTVVNSGSGSGSTSFVSLIVPAAVAGAAGYGYLWWRGFSFGDVMYVTRKSMTNAVAGVGKQLEHVSAALSSTKRHLNQRLDGVTSKLDDSVVITGLIQNQVEEVKNEVERSVFEIESVQRQIEGLEVKIDEVQGSQMFANQGITLLIKWVQDLNLISNQHPELAQSFNSWYLNAGSNLERTASSPASIASTGLKELQFFSQALESRGSSGVANTTADITPVKSFGESKPGLGLAGNSTPNLGVSRTFSTSMISRLSFNKFQAGLGGLAGSRGLS